MSSTDARLSMGERQPLLAQSQPKTIPKGPFATLLFLRATDAISFAIVFPYMAPMLIHLGASVNRVGAYSGLAEGGMMVTEALLAPFWAKVGPKVGKFRCIQIGSVCSVTAVILMGFCSSPWQVILCRFCMGINPMAIMSRSILSELLTPETRIRAFSLFTPSYVVGLMVGNILGGLLAKPGGKFGRMAILQRWPFVLPSLFCGVISVAALLASSVFLGKMRSNQPNANDPEANDGTAVPVKRTSMWTDMKLCSGIAGFRSMMVMVGFFECTKHGWNAVYPVLTYTSVKDGGFGLSIATIGSLMAASTMIYIMVSVLLFARIHAVFGASRLIPLCLVCFPLLILTIPLGEWTARVHRGALWTVLAAQLALRNAGAFTNQIVDTTILSMVDPFPEMTSMAYACKMMAAAIGKAVGPFAAGSLFSATRCLPRTSLGHAMGWIGLFLLSLPMCAVALYSYRRKPISLT